MALYRVRVNYTGTLINGTALSTFYFNDGGGTAQQAATAVATFMATCETTMCDEVTWTLDTEVDTVSLGDGTVSATAAVSSASGVGDSTAAEPLPNVLQVLLRLRTGFFLGGREVRGRLFIPGFTEAMSTGGLPVAGNLAVIDGAAATLVASANAQWVVWSRQNGASADITAATCWGRFAVLRSRRD